MTEWSSDINIAPAEWSCPDMTFSGVLQNVITVGGWDVYTYQTEDGVRIEFRRGDEVQVAYLENGKTPQRGIDYGTADDVAAIVQEVLATLPTW